MKSLNAFTVAAYYVVITDKLASHIYLIQINIQIVHAINVTICIGFLVMANKYAHGFILLKR